MPNSCCYITNFESFLLLHLYSFIQQSTRQFKIISLSVKYYSNLRTLSGLTEGCLSVLGERRGAFRGVRGAGGSSPPRRFSGTVHSQIEDGLTMKRRQFQPAKSNYTWHLIFSGSTVNLVISPTVNSQPSFQGFRSDHRGRENS